MLIFGPYKKLKVQDKSSSLGALETMPKRMKTHTTPNPATKKAGLSRKKIEVINQEKKTKDRKVATAEEIRIFGRNQTSSTLVH